MCLLNYQSIGTFRDPHCHDTYHIMVLLGFVAVRKLTMHKCFDSKDTRLPEGSWRNSENRYAQKAAKIRLDDVAHGGLAEYFIYVGGCAPQSSRILPLNHLKWHEEHQAVILLDPRAATHWDH